MQPKRSQKANVMGGSMITHIKEWNLSYKLDQNRVWNFPGANARNMK